MLPTRGKPAMILLPGVTFLWGDISYRPRLLGMVPKPSVSLSVSKEHPLFFFSPWNSYSSPTLWRVRHRFLLAVTRCLFTQSLCASLAALTLGLVMNGCRKTPGSSLDSASAWLSGPSGPFCAHFPGMKNEASQKSLPCPGVVRD